MENTSSAGSTENSIKTIELPHNPGGTEMEFQRKTVHSYTVALLTVAKIQKPPTA